MTENTHKKALTGGAVLYGAKNILHFLGHEETDCPSDKIRRLGDVGGAPIHWPTSRKPYAIKTELLDWIMNAPTSKNGGAK
jgi:hypothetical protein